jgi:hypothetical protein
MWLFGQINHSFLRTCPKDKFFIDLRFTKNWENIVYNSHHTEYNFNQCQILSQDDLEILISSRGPNKPVVPNLMPGVPIC